jgi:hypothetical protein
MYSLLFPEFLEGISSKGGAAWTDLGDVMVGAVDCEGCRLIKSHCQCTLGVWSHMHRSRSVSLPIGG